MPTNDRALRAARALSFWLDHRVSGTAEEVADLIDREAGIGETLDALHMAVDRGRELLVERDELLRQLDAVVEYVEPFEKSSNSGTAALVRHVLRLARGEG